jgi:hypothetical protein
VRVRKVADQMADPNVIRSAVRTFLTGSRRASGARTCGPPPCRACGLAAVPGAAAKPRAPTRSAREPGAVSSPVATNPTRHCPLDSGTRQGRFASLRDGLRPPWTRPLRRATCSAIGSPARSGHRGSDSCTPRVPPTLQRRHPDQTNHDPAEHVTTGEESPGGLRNEKVRGSNPLSSTRRQPRPTSIDVLGRAGFRRCQWFPTSVGVPPCTRGAGPGPAPAALRVALSRGGPTPGRAGRGAVGDELARGSGVRPSQHSRPPRRS